MNFGVVLEGGPGRLFGEMEVRSCTGLGLGGGGATPCRAIGYRAKVLDTWTTAAGLDLKGCVHGRATQAA